MSNSVHYPLEISLDKSRLAPQREEHSQYTLGLSYSADRPATFVHDVHLPPEILAAIEAGNVRALWLDRLEPNCLASRLLPEQPDCLVTCVQLKDGAVLRSVPPALRRASCRLLLHAALLLAAAIGALCAADGPPLAWGGALLLVWGLERAQALRRLPLKRVRAHKMVTPKV